MEDQQHQPELETIQEQILVEQGSASKTITEDKSTTDQVEKKDTQNKFVSRVSSFPIVQDSVSTVQAIANKTSLGRFALLTANSTFSKVSEYTSSQPKYVQTYYESYIQPHMEKADALGCRSLDIIQNKFPVVNQSTSDIVRAVTSPSYQIVDGVKVKIDENLKTPATQAAKNANKHFGNVVDNFEAAIDRYLPNQSESTERSAAEVNQAVRAYYLLNDATNRLSKRVSEQVKSSTSQIPRSRNDIARLAETSAFVQRTTTNIQALQENLTQSISLYAQAAHGHLPPAVTERIATLQITTSDRLQNLTQQVSTQVHQLMDYIKVQTKSETPEWLKTRALSLVELANKQIELVREQYSREDINSLEKAKNVAQALQSQVLPILENVQSQLNHYTNVARKKAQDELKLPLEYIGLNHAPKMAQA
jgi:NADH:ubiquinone oxidoreductase subunit E